MAGRRADVPPPGAGGATAGSQCRPLPPGTAGSFGRVHPPKKDGFFFRKIPKKVTPKNGGTMDYGRIYNQ